MIPEWVAIPLAVALFVSPAFILAWPVKDRSDPPYDWSSEDDS